MLGQLLAGYLKAASLAGDVVFTAVACHRCRWHGFPLPPMQSMGAASCDCPDWKWPDAKSPQRTGNPGSAALSWQAPRLPLTGVGGPVVRLRMRVRAAVEE